MHVTIDGFGGNPNLLGNLELVRKLIDRYPDEIPLHLRQIRQGVGISGCGILTCTPAGEFRIACATQSHS